MTFEVINSGNSLLISVAGSEGLRFSRLQSIIRTQFGQNHFSAGIEELWRRILDEHDAFPPEFWEFFLQSNKTGSGGKCRPVCVEMAWRHLTAAAGTMREWRPPMEDLNLESRQYGAGVSEGVEHVVLHARIHREAVNWIIQTDASNTFNSAIRKPTRR